MSAVRSHRASSHRICTMICSRCVVTWVFLDGWRSWVKDVSHLYAPVIESLHVLVVGLTVQLVCLHSHRSSHSTLSHTRLQSHGFSSLGLVFHAQYSCRHKSWAVAVERDSPSWLSSICNLIDCVNLHMGVYTMVAPTLDDTLTNRSSTNTFPSFLSIDFSFFLVMHASSFPMNKSFPAWMICDADTRGLLTSARALAHESLGGPHGHDLLPVVLDVLSSEQFSVLGPLCLPDAYLGDIVLGITFSAAPESTTTVTFFHVH